MVSQWLILIPTHSTFAWSLSHAQKPSFHMPRLPMNVLEIQMLSTSCIANIIELLGSLHTPGVKQYFQGHRQVLDGDVWWTSLAEAVDISGQKWKHGGAYSRKSLRTTSQDLMRSAMP